MYPPAWPRACQYSRRRSQDRPADRFLSNRHSDCGRRRAVIASEIKIDCGESCLSWRKFLSLWLVSGNLHTERGRTYILLVDRPVGKDGLRQREAETCDCQ